MNKSWRLLLFLTAITGLVSNVAGLRATSLIFGRGPNGTLTPTTTTTTTTTDSSNSAINQQPTSSPVIFTGIANGTDSVIDDEQINETDEVTKPPLTGIPQIDYVWDPNLPRELNGYNLSTYPFLSLVPDPEEIDFKCDGLHDGFYASLKYSCQLYHHCIYGIRHDFLCANFTAFDQKTFICQFVSEVNCKASPKYFFRNDALYVAATTTSTTTTTIAPPVTQPQPQYFDRPQQRPRRPIQRPRRPAQQADYYYDEDEYEQDDYVEEQRYPLRRRKQPQRGRTRRPEYEDEVYGGQSQGRRFNDDAVDRRPNRNRSPSAYDYDEEEEVPRPRNRNKNRYKEDRRRNQQVEDRDRFEDAPPPPPAKRPASGNKDGLPPRRKPAGRPKPQRFEEEDEEPVVDSDYDDRPAAAPANRFVEDEASKVSPSGGGSALFSRPRAPPRINRPVPLNDKRKYEYATAKPAKATTTTTRPAPVDDGYETEYEDDYEEPLPAPVVNNNERSSTLYTRENRRPAANAKKPTASVKQPIPAPIYEDDEEEEDDVRTPARPQYKQSASTTSRKIQRQPAINPQPAVIESRSKSKRPAGNAYSDEQYDEPQPRSKTQRRPTPTVNAYSDEDDTASEEEVRVPLQRNSNLRPRIQQQRPIAAGEGRAYSRKSPAVPEILAEDDEEDQPEVPQNVPIVQPPRKINRPGLLRPKPVAPVAPSAQPDESRAASGQSNFRKQFRSRDQSGRPTSTTTTTTSTTTSTTTAIPVADESDYASDEYEDDEYEPVAPPATSAEPPRSALNKNPHRFAAPAPRQTSKYAPSAPAAPIASQSSEEYFEHNSSVEAEVAPQETPVAATPPQSRQQPVRVVKRPFLPSRGGNPYLPRGLKPLGPVERDLPAYSDEDTTGGQLELGPTITGARLLEFHPPLVSRSEQLATGTTTTTTTTTTPAPVHQSLDPNRKLEEIFNSELDVTLNDALNPTLKPLSRSSPIGFTYKYSPSYYEPAANRRDSQVPSADLAQQSQIHTTFYGLTTGGGGRSAPVAAASVSDTEFYGDYEY